jgi:DNA ligase-1
MKREFLMLAHVYKNQDVGGWYMSEKLDGTRAFWDGGVSRGIPSARVPWANTTKDGRFVNEQIATGLWSRYGKVIHAPDWWLDYLPTMPLDGELWLGRGSFQELRSIVASQSKEGWDDVQYVAFDSPSYPQVFQDGLIKIPQLEKMVVWNDCLSFLSTCYIKCQQVLSRCFEDRYNLLKKVPTNDIWYVHDQVKLPYVGWQGILETTMLNVLDLKGEGLILRKPECVWTPKRLHTVLKYKPFNDAEATVTGYVWGKGKLAGLMGALVCDFNGKRLELSGFTDAERQMVNSKGSKEFIVEEHLGGTIVVPDFHNPTFPLGSKVTFKYRELSDDGIPKEARYWRKA